MIGMTPELWFSMFLIGAPCSRMLVSSNATPPPRLDSCSAELMERPMDSMLSSMRKKEAANRLAALLLARVEERRGGRLEPAVDDLVDELLGQRGVTGGQRQRHHDDAVLEALQVALSVEGLQRVGGVVLERAEERREPELLGVRAVEQAS